MRQTWPVLAMIGSIFVLVGAALFAVGMLRAHSATPAAVVLAQLPPADLVTHVGTTTVPTLSAAGYISIFVSKEGSEYVLAGKQESTPLPIASITKLMTALVGLDRLSPEATITMTKSSLAVESASGMYHVGEQLPLSEVLAGMLISSHNEAAAAIGEAAGPDFVAAMNAKAVSLGLKNTTFYNPIGLDPAATDPTAINLSSPYDIYRLLRTVATEQPATLALTTQPTHVLRDVAGHAKANIVSTDVFLGATTSLPYALEGGKTGDTSRAHKNLALMLAGPCGGTIYSVVLGSTDNFSDMRALLEYDASAYSYTCN